MDTINTLSPSQAATNGVLSQAGSLLALLGQGCAQVWDTLIVWQTRASQRRMLLSLDARLLQDIGISRSAALEEGRKPFWQP